LFVVVPPVLIQSEPFGAVCVGTSLVTQIAMPEENNVIGKPVVTALAVAGTAVADFNATALSVLRPLCCTTGRYFSISKDIKLV
jgi:hypothetical protein